MINFLSVHSNKKPINHLYIESSELYHLKEYLMNSRVSWSNSFGTIEQVSLVMVRIFILHMIIIYCFFLVNLEVTRLFRDCCMFDLQQALNDDAKKLEINTLDNQCFSALTNNIEPNTATVIEQAQFYNWVRVQFPTLFYGLELWLRKNVTLTKRSTATSEASAKVFCFIRRVFFLYFYFIFRPVHSCR